VLYRASAASATSRCCALAPRLPLHHNALRAAPPLFVCFMPHYRAHLSALYLLLPHALPHRMRESKKKAWRKSVSKKSEEKEKEKKRDG
jgi:hypothetical protein